MEKRTIVGIGESLWDCLPQGTKLGGAPVNFAYHVHQFGYWKSHTNLTHPVKVF